MGSFAKANKKPAALEEKYETQFKVAFDTRRELMAPAPPLRRRIRFRVEERRPVYRKPRWVRIRGAGGGRGVGNCGLRMVSPELGEDLDSEP
jgi:hypothetical protein